MRDEKAIVQPIVMLTLGISWTLAKSATEAVVPDYTLTLHVTVTVHDNLQIG